MKILIFGLVICLMGCTSEEIKQVELEKKQELETGKYTEKYANGNLKIKGDLVKKIRQGLWVSYYENGTLWSEVNYSDGKRNGKSASYYGNGNLRYLGYFNEDKKIGQWFFYNKEGEFEKEINYDKTN